LQRGQRRRATVSEQIVHLLSGHHRQPAGMGLCPTPAGDVATQVMTDPLGFM